MAKEKTDERCPYNEKILCVQIGNTSCEECKDNGEFDFLNAEQEDRRIDNG
jgi:hypothetical protein